MREAKYRALMSKLYETVSKLECSIPLLQKMCAIRFTADTKTASNTKIKVAIMTIIYAELWNRPNSF